MIWKRWISAVVLLALAASWQGCFIFRPPPLPKETKCIDDVVRLGDVLTVNLLDIPDPPTDRTFAVAGDGTVNIPRLGAIAAAGKKFDELEREIRKQYIDKGIYREVTVTVKPGDRFYSVAGEVKAPGRQIYQGKTTVLRAIATCGDFNEFASRRSVQITRADGTVETVDCIWARKDPRYDVPICPGDHITVLKSF